MKRNFKLIIEYDGSNYHGWQRQKTDRTVQQDIEKALSQMTGQTVTLIGSGRTDSGVHAYGQVANFLCETQLDPQAFQAGLNSLLPDDIVIRSCEEVEEAFHARYDVKRKTYRYRILNRRLPAAIDRQYEWFIQKRLDLDAMRAAMKHLIGTHDFKAFEGSGSPRAHTTRTLERAELTEQEEGYLVFELEANGFLRFMVRNIMGTLVDVGLGKTTPDEFKAILLSKDRRHAGRTAPPQGLFLLKVTY